MRRSFMTRMRSARWIISGRSLEMSRMASPCPARSQINPWSSYLVLTSMPTVGSSTIKMRVFAAFLEMKTVWHPIGV